MTGWLGAEGPAGQAPLLTPDELDVIRTHEAGLVGRDFSLRWIDYAQQQTDAPRDFHDGRRPGV